MYFFRKAGAKVLLFFELTKYFPRKMHFFAAFYSFLFILLHFSMISGRFRAGRGVLEMRKAGKEMLRLVGDEGGEAE